MGDIQQFDELAIRGFRGLSDLKLDGLGNINILLGANDVGKTSVLEAIFLLTGLAEPKLSVRLQNWRNYLVNEIDDFSPMFFELDSDSRVELVAHSHDPEERRELIISTPPRESSVDQKNQPIRNGTNGHGVSTPQHKRTRDQSYLILYGSRVLRYDATLQSAFEEDSTSFSVMLVDHGDQWGVIKNPEDSDTVGFTIAVFSCRITMLQVALRLCWNRLRCLIIVSYTNASENTKLVCSVGIDRIVFLIPKRVSTRIARRSTSRRTKNEEIMQTRCIGI